MQQLHGQKKQIWDSGKYFLLLFLCWTIVGGIMLLCEKHRSIYVYVNGQHTALGDIVFPYVSWLGTGWTVIVVLLLLLLIVPKFRTWRYFFAFVFCNIVPFLLAQLIKNIVNAPRPLTYFHDASWIHRVAGQPVNHWLSFPSGHTEGAFALFCLLSLLLPKKYAAVGVLFFLLALATGYSRIYLSQHFFADVYAGSLLGTIFCLLVFEWIKAER
jgi:membrane-associated phospholipid phosphatase